MFNDTFIKLFDDDPIVLRSLELSDDKTLTEVGFVPGDPYGCKMQARKLGDSVQIYGVHSRTYGCPNRPQVFYVEVIEHKLRHFLEGMLANNVNRDADDQEVLYADYVRAAVEADKNDTWEQFKQFQTKG